jgi:chromosome segregation ATPase
MVVMRRVCLPGLLGIALLAGGATFGADQPDTSKNPTTTKADAQTKTTDNGKHTANKPVAAEGTKAVGESKKAARTHLPAHFGKIGLSAEQRQQMKAVMDKYSGQIKDLEAKINVLKTQREGELHSLLTDAQKKAVEDAKAVAENARKEAKENRLAAQKALAERQAKGRELSAQYYTAEQKLLQEAAAKKKAAQEKAKEAKSKPAAKESVKEAPKTQAKDSTATQTQPEKK